MSNAGIGLSPNKQAATGKVSPSNQHGNTVKQNYLKGMDDGRGPTREGMPAGSLSAKATGIPIHTGGSPTKSAFFKTNQPKAPSRALGTPGRLTGK